MSATYWSLGTRFGKLQPSHNRTGEERRRQTLLLFKWIFLYKTRKHWCQWRSLQNTQVIAISRPLLPSVLLRKLTILPLWYGWICERAGWSESCVLIGYPRGQDAPILPARDFPRWPARKSQHNVTLNIQQLTHHRHFHHHQDSIKLAIMIIQNYTKRLPENKSYHQIRQKN